MLDGFLHGTLQIYATYVFTMKASWMVLIGVNWN